MVVFLTLYASSEQEPIISAELARKSRAGSGLEGIILLKQFIDAKEKPYFSILDGKNEVYQQEGNLRTITFPKPKDSLGLETPSNLGGEVDKILEFLEGYKLRKAAEKKS